MLAATIVDPDYGISSLKSRAGGKAWPDGSHAELSYNHTHTESNRIIGYTVDRATWENNPPLVSVSFTEIRRWVAQVPEAVKTELRLQFAAMTDERRRSESWCRCHWVNGEVKEHKDFLGRAFYHPSKDEDQRRRGVMAALDDRQADWVLRTLGLASTADPEPVQTEFAGEIPGQLELFEVAS
jgi:hypothetical protein